jgi:hypothetical protein
MGPFFFGGSRRSRKESGAKKASDALKESEKREALEKAGQGNLFTTQKRE